MQQVRPPAVAGSFYPADAAELGVTLDALLAEVPVSSATPPKAIIVPHAGYVYSGPTAATAYAELRALRGQVRRVLLLGPAHRVAFRGLAVPSDDAFATPLGSIPLDDELRLRALQLAQVCMLDEAHRSEHCLEVQLPFLQSLLGEFQLLPMVVGNSSAVQVAEVLEALWGGPETLIVISSDLSHYLDYHEARRRDRATCSAIESLDASGIGFEDACGRLPVVGLLRAARCHGLRVTTLDLRNSGDTAGPRDRVVGYGAWAFREPDDAD